MRTALLRGLAVGIGLLWSVSTAQAASSIRWAKSFSAAMAEAKKTNKLVMVDFYTDWCGWCKKLDKDTYTAQKVIQVSEQLVSVKVNAEKEGTAQAKKYSVTGFPTILFLDSSGEVAGRIGGYMPAEPFAGEMTKFIKAQRDLPSLEARAKSNPDDVDARSRLAVIYAGRGRQSAALDILQKLEMGDTEKAGENLAKAYNALADAFQEKQQFDKAIPLFQKAIKNSKTPYDTAYAHLSIAVCLLSQGKQKEAVPELEAAAAVSKGPKDLKEQAEQMLKSIKANAKGQ